MLTARSSMPIFHRYETVYPAIGHGIFSRQKNAVCGIKWLQTKPLPLALFVEKRQKKRYTVLVCFISYGSQKFELRFIVHAKGSWLLKRNWKDLGLDYHHEKKVWMTPDLFHAWPLRFNKFIESQIVECYCSLTAVQHMEQLSCCVRYSILKYMFYHQTVR